MKCPKCGFPMIHLNYGKRRYGWYCMHCDIEIPVEEFTDKIPHELEFRK